MPARIGRFVLALTVALILASVARTDLAAQEPEVTRAVVAAGIEDREPVGETDRFAPDVERVYFYTVFEGDFPESHFEHVWLHEGEEMARIALTARGPRWRTWSSKAMLPEWAGEWVVRVEDENGRELAAARFQFGG